MIARPPLPERPTGMELYDTVIAFIRSKGMTQSAFCRLNNMPQALINSVRMAKYPKPPTIARFRSAMASWPGAAPESLGVAQQVKREADASAARRALGSIASIHKYIPPAKSLAAPIGAPTIDDADPRPEAMSREPCPRCAVRGDLGCEHQRPFVRFAA